MTYSVELGSILTLSQRYFLFNFIIKYSLKLFHIVWNFFLEISRCVCKNILLRYICNGLMIYTSVQNIDRLKQPNGKTTVKRLLVWLWIQLLWDRKTLVAYVRRSEFTKFEAFWWIKISRIPNFSLKLLADTLHWCEMKHK